MRRNRQTQLKAARKCSLCDTMHTRKHSQCRECYRRRARERAQADPRSAFEARCDWYPSRPPPPPPGFFPSDRMVGRPLE